MPLDGMTLGLMAEELDELLRGGKIEKITQPEKDTVILLVHAGGKNHKLLLCAAPSFARAHITTGDYVNPVNAPMFCMLLRKHLGSARISSITQYAGDRVLVLRFDCTNELGDPVQKALWLEIMGHHSNLTFVNENGVIVDAVRHVGYDMSRVRQALPGVHFVPPPLQDKAVLAELDASALHSQISTFEGTLKQALQNRIRGLSACTANELSFRLSGFTASPAAAEFTLDDAERLKALWERLTASPAPRVMINDEDLPGDLLAFEHYTLSSEKQKPVPSLSAAADSVFGGRDKQDRQRQRSISLRKLIRNAIEREEKKLQLQREEEAFGSKADTWRIYGELLNAQLYLVQRGAERAQVQDFYSEDGGMIEIPLDKTLSPAQNAQKYFKKYRKAMGAAQSAREQISRTLRAITLLENVLDDLDKCETENDLSEVRSLLAENGYIKKEKEVKGKKKETPGRQMIFLSPTGHIVEVGKNSLQNERVTFSGRAGDLWLHAKDIPGSHVLIRRGESDITDADILFGAKLASFYSSRHGRGVQVDYTDKRNVKKPSGAPHGFVTYTGQHSLLVDCTAAEAEQFSTARDRKN